MMLLWFVCPAAAREWPRFRGPNGAGQADANTIPIAWTANDYNWRVKLPGIGYSSPVVRGQRIFVTCASEQDATRIIHCLSTSDGGLIWKRSFPSTTYSKHVFNSYAASSPAADADHVYMTWTTPQEYIAIALDTNNGRQVWRRDLGGFVAQHGFGSSPILLEDMVILANDQDGKSSAIALDRATGRTRWNAPRRTEKAAYSTPCIYRPNHGAAQLIFTSWAHGVDSLDPHTGKTNWELAVFKNRVVGSPTIAAGLIFASSGTGAGGRQMFAVKPGNQTGGVQAAVAYEITGSLPYVPTPIAYGRLLFLWSDSGVVQCLDAPTGKVHWKNRVGGKFFGSPVRVADRLYCISRQGEMVVLAADRQFKLLGRINLEEPSNSTPAIADGVMYLRTRSHLMAIGGRK